MNNDAFQTMLAESVGTVWHDVVTEDIYDKSRGRVLAYLSGGL